MRKRVLATTAILVLFSGPLSAKESLLEKNRAQMAAMPAGIFALGVVVADDDMRTAALFSSEASYATRSKNWMERTDTWLAAAVDKKTGLTVIQLVGSTFYTDEWRYYRTATYSTPAGPVDATPKVNRQVIGCVNGCKFTETLYVTVNQATLRAIAAGAEPWRFRFQADHGPVWEEEMDPREVAAFLAKVDGYRAAHGLR